MQSLDPKIPITQKVGHPLLLFSSSLLIRKEKRNDVVSPVDIRITMIFPEITHRKEPLDNSVEIS
jgi:hypothetical protein